MKTGWESMWVGSIIYFIPFFFVMNPALVMQGNILEGLGLMLLAGLGTMFICGGAFRVTRRSSAICARPARSSGRSACCW